MNGGTINNRLALRLRRMHRTGGDCCCGGHGRARCHHHHHHHHEAEADPHHAEAQHVTQLKEQLLRTQAEFDNFRKRTRREIQQQTEMANQALVEALLPVLDNFERAISAPGETVEALLTGVQMVRKQLVDILEQAGLERVDALGQPFDPNLHEAVATGEAGETPDNHVMEVLQPGYLLKGRLVRPAMVRVARG